VPNSYYGNEAFTWSAAEWVQPSVPGNSHYANGSTTGPDASFWDGVGSSSIIQAGADSISDTTPLYKFWTEDWPLAPIIHAAA